MMELLDKVHKENEELDRKRAAAAGTLQEPDSISSPVAPDGEPHPAANDKPPSTT